MFVRLFVMSLLTFRYFSTIVSLFGAGAVFTVFYGSEPFFTAPAPAPAPSKPFRRLRLRLRPKCVGSGGSGSASRDKGDAVGEHDDDDMVTAVSAVVGSM